MPNVTITQLPQATPLTGTESVAIVQGGQTRQTTTGAIANAPTLQQTFLTIVQEPTLPNSRYFSTGTGLGLTDGGAQSFYRLTLNGASGSLELASTGIIAKTGGATVVARSIASGSSGIAITNPDGVSGNPTVALTGTVLSLASLATTGMLSINGGSVNARTLYGTANEIAVANGTGTADPVFRIADNAVFPGTGGVRIPAGTTAQRPAGVDGLIRYNTETNGFEVYENGSWSNLPTGAVTLIDTGTGLTGGPITTSGTIEIANTGVTADSYGEQSKTLQITVNAQGQLTAAAAIDILIANTQVTGLGTMSTQNANNVAITGGAINGTTIGASTATTGAFTTATATTVDTTNIQVTNLKAKDGTAAATIADSTGKITVSTELDVDNLNLAGNTLSSTNTNGSIVVAPNGTGDVQLDADTVRIGDLNATAYLTTNGTGNLYLNTNGGTNSGSIEIQQGVNGNILLAPNGTGQVQITSGELDVVTIEVTNIKARDGTAAATIANSTGNVTISTLLNVDNLRLDGNTLSVTNTDGDLNLSANGTGTSWLNVNWGVNSLGNLIPKTNATYDIGDASYKPRDVSLTRDLTVGRNIGVTGYIGSPTYIQFNTTQSPLPTDATGKLYYNSDDQFQTLAYQMNGNVVHKIGEELYYRIKCQGSITRGQVVSFAGTLGASGGLIGKAATGLTKDQSYYILGIAAESGVNNDWIFVTTFGEVKNLNTTGGAEAWVQGQELYYDPTVTGGLTKNKPAVPNAIALVAAVVNVGTSNGILFVRPTYGSVLGGTDGNVNFGTLNDGDLIQYYGSGQYWRNIAPSTLTVTIGTTSIGLGQTSLTLGGLTSVAVTQAPTSALQLATKQYVDDAVSTGIDIHTPVRVESPTALNATYAPGGTAVTVTTISGGDTLTFSTSPSLSVNDQIVFSSSSNGIVAGTAYYVFSVPAANQVTLSLSYNGPKTTFTNGTGLTIAGLVNAGVGATLTNAGTKAALQIDGVSLSVSNRVLVYNQANAYENGVYTVTTVGTPDPGGTNWVLTRSTDTNKYQPDSTNGLGQGDYFFVQEGSTGAGESYVLTTANPLIIGTTNLTFTQFSASQVYSAGTGLTLTGTQFSLTSPVTAVLGGTGQTAYTAGDLLYATSTTALSKLAIGASTYILTSSGTAPQWSDPTTVTVGTATNATNTAITEDTSTAADVYPTWVTANTGNLPQKVTSTKLFFKPSTGVLTATGGISGGTF